MIEIIVGQKGYINKMELQELLLQMCVPVTDQVHDHKTRDLSSSSFLYLLICPSTTTIITTPGASASHGGAGYR